MRFARYRSRAQQFRALRQTFQEIQTKADTGQVHYRTLAQVQARAKTQCRRSPLGQLVTVEAKQVQDRIVLCWQIKVNELRNQMQQACPELAEGMAAT